MESIRELIQRTAPPGVQIPAMSPEEYERQRKTWYNTTAGNLDKEDGINCDRCRNRGFIETEAGELAECSCMKQRRAVKAMRSSGLGGLIDKTFEGYEVSTPWRECARNMAQTYANKADNSWLYFGGQHGCGKTHLCTAVCKSLIDQGRSVKYMLWGDISQHLDALKFKADEYERFLGEIKSVDVLYIDDFLKTATDANNEPAKPGTAELHNAYTVINARYFADKKTIISSEHFLTEYECYDGAAAGRIREKVSTQILIKREPGRNYRKNGGIIV